jgi:hypothetical protein
LPRLDQAIIQLRETGALQELYNKWWYDVSRCPKQDADADAKEGETRNAHYASSILSILMHIIWSH